MFGAIGATLGSNLSNKKIKKKQNQSFINEPGTPTTEYNEYENPNHNIWDNDLGNGSSLVDMWKNRENTGIDIFREVFGVNEEKSSIFPPRDFVDPPKMNGDPSQQYQSNMAGGIIGGMTNLSKAFFE